MRRAQSVLDGMAAPAVVAAAVMAMVGCAPEKPSDAEATQLEVEAGETEHLDDGEAVVARIGGEEITREEFDRRIEGLVDFARVRVQSDERREDFLDRIVEFEVMAGEANRRGFGGDPRTRHAMKRTMAELLVEDHLREEVSMADIGEDDLRAYLETNTDEFHEDERRRLARLVVDDQVRADELISRWNQREFEDAEEAGRAFQRFAFQHSTERKTGDEGGDVGWRSPEDDGVYGEDIFDWEPGQLQGPFDDDGRQVLMMVVEVEPEQRPTVEDLEQELTRQVYENRRDEVQQQFIEGLMDEAVVEIHEQRLEKIEPPRRDVPPPLEELPRMPAEDTEQSDE